MSAPSTGKSWCCGARLEVSRLKRDDGRTPPIRRCVECGRTEFPKPTVPSPGQIEGLVRCAETLKTGLEGVLALANADPRRRHVSGFDMRRGGVDRAEERLSKAMDFDGRGTGSLFLLAPAQTLKAIGVLHGARIGIRMALAKGDKGQDLRQELSGAVGSLAWAVETLRAGEAHPAARAPAGPGGAGTEIAPTSDLSMLSCGDMATIHHLDARGKNALEQRLKAWRFGNEGDWVELPNPTKNSPRFLYRYRAVKHLCEAVATSQGPQSRKKAARG